jgi:hypothetical protein
MDLMSICGALVEANGLISVPHFYDKVRPISQTDRDAINQAVAAGSQREATGSGTLKSFTAPRQVWDSTQTSSAITRGDLERVWQQPALSVRHLHTNPKVFFSK